MVDGTEQEFGPGNVGADSLWSQCLGSWRRASFVVPGRYGDTERTECGHSTCPTAEYRDLFGYLAFGCGRGKMVIPLSNGPMVVPRDGLSAVPGDDAQMYRLPSEVREAGVSWLTAVIHTRSAFNPLWLRYVPEDPKEVDWPQEFGGQLMLEKIIARAETVACEGWPAMEISHIDLPVTSAIGTRTVDAVLYELLTPERTRQYGEMMKAMDRVCELISANRT